MQSQEKGQSMRLAEVAAELRGAGFKQLEFLRGRDLPLATGGLYVEPDHIRLTQNLDVAVLRDRPGAYVILWTGSNSSTRTVISDNYRDLLSEIDRMLNYFGPPPSSSPEPVPA